MSRPLFVCVGGALELPPPAHALVDAADGGHLVVSPPRLVWERSELAPDELAAWSALVAAAGRAMLDVLPALAGGCLNYWEAGNWALHDDAEPRGPKEPRRHRRVHLHLLGRSPRAASAAHRWGESPAFPRFADRLAWAAPHRRLDAAACTAIVTRAAERLRAQYGFAPESIGPWEVCSRCGYPRVAEPGIAACDDCALPGEGAR